MTQIKDNRLQKMFSLLSVSLQVAHTMYLRARAFNSPHMFGQAMAPLWHLDDQL